MRRQLLRMSLALVTFSIGVNISYLINGIRNRAVKNQSTNSQAAQSSTPARFPLGRTWPEPRSLDLELVDADKLPYGGYVVTRLYKTVKIEDWSAPERARPEDVDVSYAVLARNGVVLERFDDGSYHPMGNTTKFGVFGLLGVHTKQLLVSQTIWRGGHHWIVRLSPGPRVIHSSADWGIGGETISTLDLDDDGVDEIVESVSAFYDLQDKLSVSQIPLPEVIFKYDAKAARYLPANRLHSDYLLKDLEAIKRRTRQPARDKFVQLADALNVTLRLIYAGEEQEGWSFYNQAYQLEDKEEVRSRVETDLRDDPVYQFIYQNRRRVKQTAELRLPANMKMSLDQRFPGWKYADVDEEIRKFLKEDISPYARPDIINGDFDGDGRTDYAVMIEQRLPVRRNGGSGESKYYLIVFLTRRDGFKRHVLDPEGEYLCLMARGEWDYDYETQSCFTYQTDAIFTGIFEKGGTSYIYKNGKFQTIITSD